MFLQIAPHTFYVHTLKAKKVIADTLYTQVVNPIDWNKIWFDYVGIGSHFIFALCVLMLWANHNRWFESKRDTWTAVCFFTLGFFSITAAITWWIN